MKKHLLLICLLMMSITFFSCSPDYITVYIGDDKHEIVADKYGEVEYINQDIYVYKNLKDEFNHIDELDYIISHSGNRGSVSPELSENFYVMIDIVKHDNAYKILVYNNMMKEFADKTKMFILTDYFLPISIENVIALLDQNEISQDIKDFQVMFTKKDSNLNGNIINNDDITLAVYNKQPESKVFMSLYDHKTGNSLVGTKSNFWFGNVKDKELYFPTNLDYKDLTYYNYDTLNDEKVQFSLNKGETFKDTDHRLEAFDIWGEAINSEVYGKVFFYAFDYEEFVDKANEARNPNIYAYNYLDEAGFDLLIETYNEAYFESNILIFYYKSEANISPNYIYSVTKQHNTLTVNVNRFEGMATALSRWLEIITIKKEDITEINKVNLIVRTISNLQSSVTVYINEAYMRDFYINGKTLEDFKDLDNLKEIKLFTWSLNVDLIFNKTVSDDDLNSILTYLENNPYVKSVGYKGKDFIRVQLNGNFYDKVINKTLVISDFIKDETLVDDYALTIKILNFTPMASIQFVLEKQGKDYAFQMIEDLKKGNYPFIAEDWLYWHD